MKKFLHHKLLKAVVVIALFMTSGILHAQSIWTNPITGTNPNSANPYTTGDDKDANITVSGIGRGSGITGNAGTDRYNATAWSTAAIDLNDYFSFTLTPAATCKINFSSLDLSVQRTSTGPANFAVRSSLDNYGTNITTFTAATSTVGVLKTIILSGVAFQNITSAITFRVYGYTAGMATGTASVNDFTFNGTVVVPAVAPVITSALTGSSVYATADSYTIVASGSPTSYSATPLPAGATLSGNVISFSNSVAAGTYTITLSATNPTGTDTKTLVYSRNKAAQSIAFLPDPIPVKYTTDVPFSLNAAASSGLSVSYSSSDTNVATLSGNTLTIVGAGTTQITASQAGNANYNAATDVVRTLTVLVPTITITNATPAGPFCSGTTNLITLNFTTEGTFTAGFAVQYSNVSGVFPALNTENIIGNAASSPIEATFPSGLVSGNYKIRVINATANAYSAAYASDFVIVSNTWTGMADTNWNNPGNWSCGILPTASVSATIAATSNQPILSGNTNALANEVTVNSGATLTVASGNSLTVTTAVTVAAGGQMTVEHNANLVQVNDVTNMGPITVRKNSLPLFRNDYTLWSSPVLGQNLMPFSPLTLASRFYTYNTSGDLYAAVTAPQTTAFAVGQGYLIRMPDTGSPLYYNGSQTLVFEGDFIGTPNNGLITFPLITLGNGFNAIGNPYPSTIDFSDFIDANILNHDIEGQIWLWRKTNDSSNTSYATMTKAAYVRNDANGGGVPNNQIDPQTYQLNASQGFIVKSLTGTVKFNNAMRSTSYGNPAFKNPTDNVDASRFWLNLTSASGDFSQTAVVYRNDATSNYDDGLDGRRFESGNTSLYSFAQGIDLTIQARQNFAATDEVPLGFKVTASGNFTISIDNLDGLFANQSLFIKDNTDGSFHDLKASSYTFSTVAGTFNDRFKVVYQSPLGLEDQADASNFTVYKQDAAIVIDGGIASLKNVSVFDLRGRLLYDNAQINASKTVIRGLQSERQVLVVKITTSENTIVTRKIIY